MTMKIYDYDEMLKDQLLDQEFKDEYDALDV